MQKKPLGFPYFNDDDDVGCMDTRAAKAEENADKAPFATVCTAVRTLTQQTEVYCGMGTIR